MNSLAEILKKYHAEITKYLYLGYARWDELIKRIEKHEQKPLSDLNDEQIWTFLIGCGYAIAGAQGFVKLTKTLTGSDQKQPDNLKIWFEVLPISPREKEGETHLDLALGTIALREGTESGIELDNEETPWICFCEMKWYSDISTSVTYDVHRNQLARVIENALCFQGANKYAESVYVTLVTPSIFRHTPIKSRLYQYKFEEYDKDKESLLDEIKACALEKNKRRGWSYPFDLSQRIVTLTLRWTTYDELFEHLPDSDIAITLKNFWIQYRNY